MELITQNFPWLAGIGGILAVFWNQAKSIFFQVKSLIILEYEFADADRSLIYEALKRICNKKLVLHANIVENYNITDPKTKKKHVFFYTIRPTIFFYNKFPIFFKSGKIIYLRGTIPLSLFREMEIEHDNYRNRTHSNFQILDVYGKVNEKIQVNNQEAPMLTKAVDSGSSTNVKFRQFLTTDTDGVLKLLENDNHSFLETYNEDIIKKYNMIKHWKDNQDWFKCRKIPWNRSIRIEGSPGSGKSTLIHSMAMELGLPIIKFHLSTMDNKDFTEEWKRLSYNSPCIVLFEDFDRLFNNNREFILEKLTLDCVLNAISGVSEVDGILTIITANFPEKLDPAMGEIVNGKSTRPGRLDFVMTINELTEKGRRVIANNILDTFPELIEPTVNLGEGETAAQFSQRCIELAQAKFYENMENLNV